MCLAPRAMSSTIIQSPFAGIRKGIGFLIVADADARGGHEHIPLCRVNPSYQALSRVVFLEIPLMYYLSRRRGRYPSVVSSFQFDIIRYIAISVLQVLGGSGTAIIPGNWKFADFGRR